MHVNQVRIVMEQREPIQEKTAENQQFCKTDNVGSWDEQDSMWTFEEVEEDALITFMKQIQEAGRLSPAVPDAKTVLERLYLVNHQYLKNAAAVFLCDSEFCDIQLIVYKGEGTNQPSKLHRFHGRWEKVITNAEEAVQEETEGYPDEAIHELLLNAFCHRNFGSTQCNQIVIDEKHIEIFNPGIFPEGYETEDFCSGGQRPVPANPLIARTLYYTGSMDGLGLGIKRARSVCENAEIQMKLQRDKGGVVAVLSGGRLRKKQEDPFGTGLTANERVVLEYLRQYSWVSNASAREIVHMGTTATRNLLNGLVDKGLLKAEGENRGRKYCLTDAPFSGYTE